VLCFLTGMFRLLWNEHEHQSYEVIELLAQVAGSQKVTSGGVSIVYPWVRT